MNKGEQIEKNIRKAYLLKFGNLYISNKGENSSDLKHCYTASPTSTRPEKPPLDINKIIDCFDKSPQVNLATLCDKKRKVAWSGYFFDPMTRWHFSPALRLELNIPVKNQKLTKMEKSYHGDLLQTPSKFTVFYDGSNYVVCTSVKDITKPVGGILDVREFLRNTLEKEFKIEEIPPNPMREDYYLLFLSNIRNLDTISDGLLPNQVLMLRPQKNSRRKNGIISKILTSSLTSIFFDVFYAGSMISARLEEIYVELNRLHTNVQKKTKELFTTSSLNLRRRDKIKNNLEKMIIDHYELILDYNVCLNLIQEARLNVNKISEIGTTNPLFPFFKLRNRLTEDNYKYYPLNPDVYNACLDYTKKVMERTFSWRLALYGALFGTASALLVGYGPDIINVLRNLAT